jgi:hypothetical protein
MVQHLTEGLTMKRQNVRNLLLALSLTAGALAAPAYAQINFNLNIGPPAPQHEVVPVIPAGYVWAPGYWGWSGERHVWVRGRSILQRPGYDWSPDRWDKRDKGYYRTAGHWVQVKAPKPEKHNGKGWAKGHDNKGKGKGH